MGFTYAWFELINPADQERAEEGTIHPGQIRTLNLKLLVDSGAYNLCLNEELNRQLGLKKRARREIEFANGERMMVDVVGPVIINFENRTTSTNAIVLPGNLEPLMGVVPLEDLDVVIDPVNHRLMVNPESPYIARGIVK